MSAQSEIPNTTQIDLGTFDKKEIKRIRSEIDIWLTKLRPEDIDILNEGFQEYRVLYAFYEKRIGTDFGAVKGLEEEILYNKYYGLFVRYCTNFYHIEPPDKRNRATNRLDTIIMNKKGGLRDLAFPKDAKYLGGFNSENILGFDYSRWSNFMMLIAELAHSIDHKVNTRVEGQGYFDVFNRDFERSLDSAINLKYGITRQHSPDKWSPVESHQDFHEKAQRGIRELKQIDSLKNLPEIQIEAEFSRYEKIGYREFYAHNTIEKATLFFMFNFLEYEKLDKKYKNLSFEEFYILFHTIYLEVLNLENNFNLKDDIYYQKGQIFIGILYPSVIAGILNNEISVKEIFSLYSSYLDENDDDIQINIKLKKFIVDLRKIKFATFREKYLQKNGEKNENKKGKVLENPKNNYPAKKSQTEPNKSRNKNTNKGNRHK